MPLTDYAMAGGQDLPRERFVAILAAANSPAAGEAAAMHAALVAAGVRPAPFLGFFWVESKFGTVGVVLDSNTKNPGNVRTPELAALATGTVITPRGQFATYATWTNGTADWAARIRGPKYEGSDLRTVRQVLPRYAPSSDDNDPVGYAATVLALVARWTGGIEMGHVLQPPITQIPIVKVMGVGRDPDLQRSPRFTVLHSMGGTLNGTTGHFTNPNTAALTDFGIGNINNSGGFAEIIQWNDPFGMQIGWASGPVKVPQGDGPAALAAFGGAGGLNRYGVSIEHDDTTRADGTIGVVGGEPVSAAQWSASCWLQAFIHAEWLGQTADSFSWNMHHREFCGSAYKDCPNPRIYNHTNEYQDAIKAIMRHFQEGAAYPAGGLVVAGEQLALPPQGVPPDEATVLKRWSEAAIPFFARGNLVQEGEVDLRQFPGGGAKERLARYDRLVTHRLDGNNFVFQIDLLRDLSTRGLVTMF